MGHGHELRLRELERRYELMGNDLRTLRRQTTAVREGVRDYWIDGIGRSPATTAPCLTYYSGVIQCCTSGVAIPVCTMHVVGRESGVDYGTYSCPGGDFAFGVYLDGAEVAFLIACTKTGTRFRSPSLPINVTTAVGTRCTANAIGNAAVFGASGYNCAPGLCAYPISNNLKLDDPRKGVVAQAITSIGGGGSWTGGGYELSAGATSTLRVTVTPPGSIYLFGTPTSVTCPDDAGTTFSATFTAPSTSLGYTAGDTVTVYE